MKLNKILNLTVVIAAIILLPFTADAANVSWNSESYNAFTSATHDAIGYVEDDLTSSTLSVHSDVGNDVYGSVASSDIYWDTSSGKNIMSLWTDNGTSEFGSSPYSSASFTGTYTALLPQFDFTFDMWSFGTANTAWIQIEDLNTSEIIYNEANLQNSNYSINGNSTSSSGTITAYTTTGHDIQVSFGTERGGSLAGELSYNIAVAPEPISSILFITGGTLLAGRRHIKRKKKS